MESNGMIIIYRILPVLDSHFKFRTDWFKWYLSYNTMYFNSVDNVPIAAGVSQDTK